MSPFSRCKTRGGVRPNPLPPSSILKVVLVLAVLVAMGLAHIHLRMKLSQTRREIASLQGDQGRLLSEINAVRTSNEAIKTPRNLQTYARNDLNMVAYNPSRRETIVIPEQIQTRYALARSSGGIRPAGERVDEQDLWLSSIGERIGLIGEAQARQPSDRP
jgi:hypothetical protein